MNLDLINTSMLADFAKFIKSTLPAFSLVNAFPFMQLPPEIRMTVYKAYFKTVDQLPQRSSQPGHFPIALLQASKTIYAEAGLVYYHEYPFATPSYSGRSGHGYSDRSWVSVGSLTSSCELQIDSKARLDFTSCFKVILSEDVSKIFTKYHKDLPQWLFGAPYLRSRLTFRSVKRPLIPGYEFARNLRQIGRQNAVEIRSLRINVRTIEGEHLQRACYELPLYSTIIKQHMYNVRDIVLELGSMQCPYPEDYHNQLHNPFPQIWRGAFGLKHRILKHIRRLILHLPHICSVEVVANCRCIPPGFVRLCKTEICRTFRTKSAAASAQ